MNAQIEKAESMMKAELSENEVKSGLLDRLTGAMKIIERTTSELKKIVKDNSFENDMDEIDFFKHQYPLILARKLEEGIKYNLLINKPIETVEMQIRYFEDQLKVFQSFFRLNAFHYQYYKNNMSELDNLYFLKNTVHLTIPPADVNDPEEEFATPMSWLFAKFHAYETILYFVLEQIAELKFPGLQKSDKHKPSADDMVWSGDVINLTELAYGLWLTGQLNNGNASLNQIVRWLEKNLSVSIGIAQRKFSEISRRKRISVTKFLDQMREAVLKKMESDYE